MVFEFIIATLFFLAIVMYTINYLNSAVYSHSGAYRTNIYESKVWRVSEVLVRNPGVWSGGAPDEIGLAEEWPRLNETKINDLNASCSSDMDGVLELLDIDFLYNGIKLEIEKYTGAGETNMLSCGSLPPGKPNSKITRFGVSDTDDRLLKVNVWYW